MSKPLHFGTAKRLPLEEEWKENNIIDIVYLSYDGAFMNTDIGLILDLVRQISIQELRKGGLNNISNKLIIFDVFEPINLGFIFFNLVVRYSSASISVHHMPRSGDFFQIHELDILYQLRHLSFYFLSLEPK